MNYADLDALHAAVGDGHVSARSVAQRLARELQGGGYEEQLPTTVSPGLRSKSRRNNAAGVFVEGLDDVVVRLSRCCTPVPGDQIVGFVTRGRGVSVHRADCANAAMLAAAEQERLIEVEWSREGSAVFVASVEVLAFDRSRLLADVTRVVSEHHLNIVASSSHTAPDRVSRMHFDVELADPGHLDSLLSSLKQLDGVFDAYRTLPGRKG
jgi:GTP pyrophosphokinase